MQLTTILLATALALTATANNPFSFPGNGDVPPVSAGKAFNITWTPSPSTKTITLLLRQGNKDDLQTVQTIGSKLQNTGSTIWTPSATLVKANNYAFQILDDADSNVNDYSPLFSLDSPNTVSSAASSTSSASSSSSPSSSGTASLTSSSDSPSVTSPPIINTSGTASGTTTATGSSSSTSSGDGIEGTGIKTASGVAPSVSSAAPASVSKAGAVGGVERVGGGLLAGVVGVFVVLA